MDQIASENPEVFLFLPAGAALGRPKRDYKFVNRNLVKELVERLRELAKEAEDGATAAEALTAELEDAQNVPALREAAENAIAQAGKSRQAIEQVELVLLQLELIWVLEEDMNASSRSFSRASAQAFNANGTKAEFIEKLSESLEGFVALKAKANLAEDLPRLALAAAEMRKRSRRVENFLFADDTEAAGKI